MKTLNDAAPGSSPANQGAQNGDSPNSPKPDGGKQATQQRESSAAEDDSQTEEFLAKAATLEGEEPPEEGAQDSSPGTDGTEAEGEESRQQDESREEAPEAGAEHDLSQEQQQQAQSEQAEKAFKDRPEWQAAMKLVPAEKQKEMRKILRPILERENQLVGRLEKTKPAVEIASRLHKAVGNEGVENAVALVELWNRGDERAETMLTELLTDLQTRRGARLSSADLVKRADSFKQKLEGGLIEQAEYDEELAVLKELERTRAAAKRSESQMREVEQTVNSEREEQLVAETTSAMNDWEKKTAGTDPDYAKIQVGVINRTKAMVAEKLEQVKRSLTAGEMVELLKKAYAEEKAYVKSLQPARRSLTPIRGQGSSTNSRRTAQTPEEEFLQRADEIGA